MKTGGHMHKKPMETLHALMTNQWFICAVAIVLFLLVIIWIFFFWGFQTREVLIAYYLVSMLECFQ